MTNYLQHRASSCGKGAARQPNSRLKVKKISFIKKTQNQQKYATDEPKQEYLNKELFTEAKDNQYYGHPRSMLRAQDFRRASKN